MGINKYSDVMSFLRQIVFTCYPSFIPLETLDGRETLQVIMFTDSYLRRASINVLCYNHTAYCWRSKTVFKTLDVSERLVMYTLQKQQKGRQMKGIHWVRMHVMTPDLQSVGLLTTPCSNASTLYYARKLAACNFTVYNQVTGDGFCMVGLWDETK